MGITRMTGFSAGGGMCILCDASKSAILIPLQPYMAVEAVSGLSVDVG